MSDSRSSSVIVAGARTPIGRLLGGLKDLSAAELGGVAIKGALEKAGVSADQVDYLILGQVIQAGAGQNPARSAGIAAGLPMSMPSITINKVCLSGINAIALADQLIRAGEHEIVVAGGMESMTQAPHLLPKSREGFKYGDTTLVDSMAYDALFDQATKQAMINLTEACNAAGANLTREEQDAFAAQSHQRAALAWKNGIFDDEVVPVTLSTRKGEVTISEDEGVRGDTTVDALARLRQSVVVEDEALLRLDMAQAAGYAKLVRQAAVITQNGAEAQFSGGGEVNIPVQGSLTTFLENQPKESVDRFVLLDAQDWMDDAQLNALWSAITRSAAPGARVIFRTAAEADLLPGRVSPQILARWRYEAERSKELAAMDRSAIYGGFHLYRLRDDA